MVGDSLQIAELLPETIGRACGLVRLSKPEKVEGDDAAACGNEQGNQIIVDVQVVRKTVHEHEGGTGALVVARVNFALLRWNMMLDEGRFADSRRRCGFRHFIFPSTLSCIYNIVGKCSR